tara:strand:- start:435 stop:767 length:333 start_codon:yes stop_codon:yes gene_type:complete
MFRVSTNNQTVDLSAKQLAEMLVAKSIGPTAHKPQVASPLLAEAMAKQMEDRGLLREATPMTLLALGIGVGYYLNTFFRKNEVEIQEQVDAIERPSDLNREASSDAGGGA